MTNEYLTDSGKEKTADEFLLEIHALEDEVRTLRGRLDEAADILVREGKLIDTPQMRRRWMYEGVR